MSLFTKTTIPKWAGSTALVRKVDLDCIWCGPVTVTQFTQSSLFIFGGYGADNKWVVQSCRCGAVRSVSLSTTNPRLRDDLA